MSGRISSASEGVVSVGDRSLYPPSTWGSLDWQRQQRFRESRIEQEQRFGPRPQHVFDGLPGGLYGSKPLDPREGRSRLIDELVAKWRR